MAGKRILHLRLCEKEKIMPTKIVKLLITHKMALAKEIYNDKEVLSQKRWFNWLLPPYGRSIANKEDYSKFLGEQIEAFKDIEAYTKLVEAIKSPEASLTTLNQLKGQYYRNLEAKIEACNKQSYKYIPPIFGRKAIVNNYIQIHNQLVFSVYADIYDAVDKQINHYEQAEAAQNIATAQKYKFHLKNLLSFTQSYNINVANAKQTSTNNKEKSFFGKLFPNVTTQIDNLVKLKNRVKKQLSELTQNLQKLLQQAEQGKAKLQEELTRAHHNYTKLQQENAQLKKQLTTDKQQVEENRAKLQQELARVQNHNTELEQKLEQMQQNNDQLTAQLTAAKSNIQDQAAATETSKQPQSYDFITPQQTIVGTFGSIAQMLKEFNKPLIKSIQRISEQANSEDTTVKRLSPQISSQVSSMQQQLSQQTEDYLALEQKHHLTEEVATLTFGIKNWFNKIHTPNSNKNLDINSLAKLASSTSNTYKILKELTNNCSTKVDSMVSPQHCKEIHQASKNLLLEQLDEFYRLLSNNNVYSCKLMDEYNNAKKLGDTSKELAAFHNYQIVNDIPKMIVELIIKLYGHDPYNQAEIKKLVEESSQINLLKNASISFTKLQQMSKAFAKANTDFIEKDHAQPVATLNHVNSFTT
jgi:predicted  nucleic acid-binding Zn-ribbon protein